MSAWWYDFVGDLSAAIGPGPAVGLIAFTSGASVFVVGGLLVLWRTR